MKFSVLMSVYYKEKAEWFDKALESNLIMQSLLPDEFVLVCDGKLTDELEEVIKKYQEKCPDVLKVFRLDENVGLGNALNFGLEKCENEYVARSDSDDVCDYRRFEVQMNYLKEHTEIAVLGTAIDEFDTNPEEAFDVKMMPTGEKDIKKRMIMRCPLNHMSVIFKKSAVVKVGSYMHMPYLEDFFLWVRMVCAGYRIENINEVLVHARTGDDMLKRRSHKECINAWNKMDKFRVENKMITRMQAVKNKLFLRIFIHTPIWIKKYLYKYILRR